MRALLPDILDKCLMLAGVAPCGRFIGHTIFFGPIAGLAVYSITRRKDLAIAVLFGCYLHLALDANYPLPMFYPLVKYSFSCPPRYGGITIFEIVMEIIGASLLAATILFNSKLKRYGEIIISKAKRSLKISRVR